MQNTINCFHTWWHYFETCNRDCCTRVRSFSRNLKTMFIRLWVFVCKQCMCLFRLIVSRITSAMDAETISKPKANANDPTSKPTAKATVPAVVPTILNTRNNKLQKQKQLWKQLGSCGRLKSLNLTDTVLSPILDLLINNTKFPNMRW